ncbi:sensor histidine kinase [Sphingomonas glaciei]|uniref:histidine kinase n=1 Tax=Sphingomonas glaciei TaxID=2938948 RepID=A0ABY5MY28_9SPHN|nr:HWE histidine kinase domain-containing protein [Sphingomonas glaciei]UUR09342.1 PAS domain-containing protein [Sphingomonas glaciei]
MAANDSKVLAGPEERLKVAVEAACVAVWAWHVDSDKFSMDERAFELWGLPQADEVTFEELSVRIHPVDRDRVRAAFNATRSIEGSYEIDFRICLEGEVRWIAARGRGADDGITGRVMHGIFLDVTGRKQAEEGSELLAGEMSHRVKNLLSIATGLTQITARSAKTVEEMAGNLTQRLTALGRAHDFVRPLPNEQGKAALLGDLISIILNPYDETAAFSGRIRVAVARMGVGEKAATALAMIIHELATNSVKYGSLSVDTGFLDVSSKMDGDYILVAWTETGGPPIGEAKALEGFGSKLIARSVSGQLGGELTYDWQKSGLVVTVRIRRDRLEQ